MLLRDLTIENYRSFEKYKLDGLARVNLLVGDNNCGKTSVLEAVQLLLTEGSSLAIFDQLKRREDTFFVAGPTGTGERRYGASSLFHHAKDNERTSKIIISESGVDTRKLELSTEFDPNEARHELVINSSKGRKWNHTRRTDMDHAGAIGTLFQGGFAPDRGWPYESWSKCPFIGLDGLDTRSFSSIYRELLQKKRESLVVQFLQVVDDRITSIFPSPDTELRRDIWIDRADERISAADVGDGMICLISIGSALAFASGGSLVVDEIDTGLHYSKLADMWRMVIKTAVELDVQVFATTHSLDCLRSLATACRRDETLVPEVSVQKIDRRQCHSTRFGAHELQIAVENEIEVRG